MMLVLCVSPVLAKQPQVVDKYIDPLQSAQAQPEKGKGRSVAKLKEDIGDGYGKVIKKQAKLCQLMAEVNSTIVDQLGVLFTRCSASQQCLRNHLTDMHLFERQLDAFETILKQQLNQLQEVQLAPADGVAKQSNTKKTNQ